MTLIFLPPKGGVCVPSPYFWVHLWPTWSQQKCGRSVAEVTLHDFPSLVWKGEATSPWLIRALALEPWAVQLPKATGLWGSLNYPRWRDLMEKPWDYVERKREMLGRTLAPTDACWSSSSHCRTTVTCETHTRTAYHCPSQISDPQKLWSDLIHCTRNSTTPPGNTTLNTVLKISGRREEDGNSLYYMLNVLSAWNCLKKKVNGRRSCDTIVLFNNPRTLPFWREQGSLLLSRNQHTFLYFRDRLTTSSKWLPTALEEWHWINHQWDSLALAQERWQTNC